MKKAAKPEGALPLRLVGYGRVSTERQSEEGASLETQKAKCQSYCELTDARLVDWLQDEGKSGRSTRGRDKLEAALNQVFSGNADGIAVYAIDRLARSAHDFLTMIRDLRDAGKVFVSVREHLDSSTEYGRFTMGILAQVAELESDLTSKRVRDTIAFLKSERRVFGPAPFGFRAAGARLVEVPEQVEAVRRIAALRFSVPARTKARREPRDHHSFRDIAERLNAEAVPAAGGGRWYPTSVQRVVENLPDFFPQFLPRAA